MNVLKDNISSVFFKYAIPSILGMLAISSASIVDGFFVGNYVGASGLAAINISLPIFSLLFGLTLMLSVGSSVISGKLMAQGKTRTASVMFSKTLITVLIFSLVSCSLLVFNIEMILGLFGAKEELLLLSTNYLSVILFFIPFLMVGMVLDYFVKVDNRPMLAFGALLSSAFINIILDWFLIVYLEKGIFGAALATGISQMALIVILLPHFFSKKATLKFLKPTGKWSEITKAAKNGASEFVNETSVGITTLIFNYVMITTLGTSGVAAFAVINYILWIGLMVCFAIGDSMQPIISKNYGAGQPKRISQTLKFGFLSVLVIGLFLICILIAFPHELINVFLSYTDIELKKMVLSFAAVLWPVFLFIGINLVISSYFTAMHKPMPSAIIALLRSLILPILFIFTLPRYFDTLGIVMAIPASEFITFIIAIILFKNATPNKVIQKEESAKILVKRQDLEIDKKKIASI